MNDEHDENNTPPPPPPLNDDETKTVSYSESGAPMFRYKPLDSPGEEAHGNPETFQRVRAHIERYIAPPDYDLHEIKSEYVHLAINIVAPTPERPYYTLVTSGMSDRPMKVPPGYEAHQYAELYFCLPPTWKIPTRPQDLKPTFKDKNNFWPIQELIDAARMPHKYKTWLGIFHTIPNGDPPKRFAPNTKFCAWMIYGPLMINHDFFTMKVDEKKSVCFFTLLPLYLEELTFKRKHGAEQLLDRLLDADVTELISLRRKNVCL